MNKTRKIADAPEFCRDTDATTRAHALINQEEKEQ